MQQTIIGFFNSASEAESAVEKLKSSGFTQSDIDLSTEHFASYRGSESPYDVSGEGGYPLSGSASEIETPLNEDRIRERKEIASDEAGDSIGRFFRRLFDNREEAELYATVGRKSCIVSVYAESSLEAERARDIMDECGAVDVDERSRGFESRSTSRDDEPTPNSVHERRNTFTADGITETNTAGESIDANEADFEKGRRRSRIVEQSKEQKFRLNEDMGGTGNAPLSEQKND
jgi:hypothetical protein